MRHRDDRSPRVRELEYGPKEIRKILCPATHGKNNCIYARPLEPRIVDEWSLESMGGESDVGNDFGDAVDHDFYPNSENAR
jgi:hypothetical protein